MYVVIVGNIGTVYQGESDKIADTTYSLYVARSREDIGRAAGESVLMLQDGNPVAEYTGTNDSCTKDR